MKKENVESLATLFNKPVEDVTKAIETDDGLKTLVSEFTDNNKVYSLDDAIKLEKNIKSKTIENLTEADIPESFKSKAVGWKLEQKEKEFEKKYQFTDEYNGLSDLVDKIITKTKIPNDNEDEVKVLKLKIVDLKQEYKDKSDEQQQKFDTSLIKTDFDKAIKELNLDYEGDVLGKQEGLLKAAFDAVYTASRKNDKTIVLDKKGKTIEDDKYEPKTVEDVLLATGKEYGFQFKEPDPGGHGGSGSKKKAKLNGVSFDEYLDSKDVKPMTAEADKLHIEWKASNT